MANCCCPGAAETADCPSVCPANGTKGIPVAVGTVKALVTARALSRLAAVEHRFCADPSCDVVYFDAHGGCFTRRDLQVAVWQKEPAGDRAICYCFDETEAAIREEIRTIGHSSAVDRVRAHVAAKRCACEVRNPRGACCLGELIAAVERIQCEAGAAVPSAAVRV
jgi:Zinc binding domain